jgi:uncharacterized membrane protein YagU involved in acid resistance
VSLEKGERMMFDLSISWIAVVLAAVANGLVGSFWYSPQAFGTAWAESLGFDIKNMKMDTLQLVKMFATSLVFAFGIALFYDWTGSSTIWDGAVTGFWAALLFIVPSQYSGVIWANLPLTTFLINAGGSLVCMTVMGIVIGLLS